MTLRFVTDKEHKINVVASHTYEVASKIHKPPFNEGTMVSHKLEEEERIVGKFCLLFTHKLVSLWGLEIYHDYRKQGYAKRLLTVVIQALKDQGRHTLALYVRPDNLAAIKLYECLGFKRIEQQDSNSLYYEIDLTSIKVKNLPHYDGRKSIDYPNLF